MNAILLKKKSYQALRVGIFDASVGVVDVGILLVPCSDSVGVSDRCCCCFCVTKLAVEMVFP